jgi:two-component system, chemotaxis family, chemotaxis protein CheY
MAKILLIDDSSLSRRIMRGILQPQGHQIIEASDGMSGIETYLLEKPDLVMLDLLMTGMQGLEVLEKLKQIDPTAQVIVATADLQHWTKTMVEEAGAKGFVNKPFVANIILTAVNSVLKGDE